MKNLVLCAFLAVMIPGAVLAQKFELGAFGGLTPHVGVPPLGSLSDTPYNNDTYLGHSRDVYGARFTWNTKGYYGHEVGYSIQHMGFLTNYSTTLSDGTAFSAVLTDKVKVEQVFYNFLAYFMPRGERWRPFVTGGAEFARYGAPHFSQWPGGGSKNGGFNFGAGLKVKLFKHGQMRLDVRESLSGRPYTQLQFSSDTIAPSGFMHMLEASVGFAVTFK